MEIELLYFDECPNSATTEILLRNLLSELGIEDRIEMIAVSNNDEALSCRFLGSPSIRVNGKDLEITEDIETEYSMRCRIYRTASGVSGVPPEDILRMRLTEALE